MRSAWRSDSTRARRGGTSRIAGSPARRRPRRSGWSDTTRSAFFLLVDVWDPHEPWNPPDYYTRLYAPDYDGRETETCYDNWRDAGLTRGRRAAQPRHVRGEVIDGRPLGRTTVDKLDVLGIADETVVFFLSDHGYYFGEHGYLGKSVWDADLGTQSWSPLYREIVEVPLIVQCAGNRGRAARRP